MTGTDQLVPLLISVRNELIKLNRHAAGARPAVKLRAQPKKRQVRKPK